MVIHLFFFFFFSLHLDKSHDKQPIISIGIIIKPMHFHIHHLWDKLHPLIPVDLSLSLSLSLLYTHKHTQCPAVFCSLGFTAVLLLRLYHTRAFSLSRLLICSYVCRFSLIYYSLLFAANVIKTHRSLQ